MNKLVIPSILLTTVMVAGIFAFMPVEQVSTVHETDIVAQVSGASAIVSSDTITNTFAGAAVVNHWFVMSSTVPYTIQDIEVRGTIAATLTTATDTQILRNVNAFPAEYATTVADITLAVVTDARDYNLCNGCPDVFIDGTDGKGTLTYSLGPNESATGAQTNQSFGPNTKILVQITQTEVGDEGGDMSSTVTFYLKGPQASNITVTEFAGQALI